MALLNKNIWTGCDKQTDIEIDLYECGETILVIKIGLYALNLWTTICRKKYKKENLTE